MSSVSTICDLIGRKNIEKRIGVGKSSISNAVKENKFPASWYLEIVNMTAARGVECPDHLFNFRLHPSSAAQIAKPPDVPNVPK